MLIATSTFDPWSWAERIESVIAQTWPEQIDPADIGNEPLAKTVIEAREALLAVLSLDELA